MKFVQWFLIFFSSEFTSCPLESVSTIMLSPDDFLYFSSCPLASAPKSCKLSKKRTLKTEKKKNLSISTLFSVISTFAYFISIYTFESSRQFILYEICPSESQVDNSWVNQKSADNVYLSTLEDFARNCRLKIQVDIFHTKRIVNSIQMYKSK